MKKNKILDLAIIWLIIVILFAGCAGQPTGKDNKTADTIKVVDCIGREVEIPSKVKKVACFYPLAAHAVTMLNRDMEIVAVASGIKRDVLLASLNPSIEKAAIAGSGRVLNIESLLDADPDLVLINQNMAAIEGEVDKLEKSHIPYLVIKYSNMEEQQYVMSMIGKAIGEEKKAQQYNKFYNDYVNLASERVKDIPEKDKVRVFYSMSEATRTETKETVVTDWINAVGLANVVEDEKLKLFEGVKHYASLEQIYVWDPDAFMVNDAETTEYIMKNEKWAALKAVKNNRIHQLPLGISRWGHASSLEIPLTVIWAGKTFYPEKFNDIDLNQEIKKFYHDFFEYDLSEEELTKILSGVGMRL